MSRLAILFGSLLIALAISGYAMQTGQKSPTAFIPAVFGILLIVTGAVARISVNANKHAMHAAALLGLAGMVGGFARALPKVVQNPDAIHTLAIQCQLAMGLLCLVFLVLCIRWFVLNRKTRSY